MSAKVFREHWAVLALAAAIGGLLILPSLWAKFNWGIPLGDPLNIRIADEYYYFARIREVFDGYPLSGDAFTWEHKSGLAGQPVFLGEYLTAQAIRLTGLDVVAGSVVLDAVLPVFAVLLTYACLFAVTASRGLSLLGVAVLFLGFFRGDFARTVSPQLNFLFWLTQFLLLHSLFARDLKPHARTVRTAAAAVNFGLLFYLYTYYWTFWFAFLGIAFIAALLRRDRPSAGLILRIVLGGLVVALPYLIAMARLIAQPAYGETVRRIGMIDSHFPSGIAIVVPAVLLVALTALLVSSRIIRWSPTLAFLTAGALAAMVSVNQHLITGKNLEFSSHYYPLSVFWFTFFSAYLVVSVARHVGRQRVVAILAGVAAAAVAAFGVWQSIPPQFNAERGELRRYLPLFGWLETNSARDEVVFAHLALSNLVPIYTGNNVFFSSLLRLSHLSDVEVLDRFAITMQSEPFQPDAAVRTVFGVQYLDAALHTAQENRVRRLFGLPERPVDPVPAAAVERIRERLDAVRREGTAASLRRYRVDYLVIDRRHEPAWEVDAGLRAERVYDEGDFVVYRLPERR
ncbi:MAG: hypothetical protein Q8R35_04040 [bacterium]|nr:hypothetical protein [bacterium]